MPKKEKKYHYLYKTTNLLNNKYYIGMHSTDDLYDGYMGSGKYLKRAIVKHGTENFRVEIIEYCSNRTELSELEKQYVTKDVVTDKYCMNLTLGGEKFNTSGMVTVKDKNGKYLQVFVDDQRYVSGELVHIHKGKITVIDKYGNTLQVSKDDQRYVSGELVHIHKGKVTVIDKDGNTLQVSKDDPRYVSGELVYVHKGKVNVVDKNGNTLQVSKDDPRYVSGELDSVWKNRTHTKTTIDKMKETHRSNNHQKGEKNSMYGTMWIHNKTTNEPKRIKKDEFLYYLIDGWEIGRCKKKVSMRKIYTQREFEEISKKIPNMDIDFGKLGWVQKVVDELGVCHKTVAKIMKRVLPEFYEEKCYKRKSRQKY